MLKRGAAASVARAPGQKVDLKALLPPALRTALSQKRKPNCRNWPRSPSIGQPAHSGMPLTVALNSMTHLQSKGIPAEVTKELKQDVMEGKAVGLDDQTATNFFRSLRQHGARGRIQRRLSRSSCAVWRTTSSGSPRCSRNSRPRWFIRFVSVVGIAIMFFFMTYMLPKFMTIFEGMKVELPFMKQILVGLSHLFASYWWLMLSCCLRLSLGLSVFNPPSRPAKNRSVEDDRPFSGK